MTETAFDTGKPFAANFYASTITPGRYRHYKGKYYIVFGTVTHSETEEIMVLYAPEAQTAGEARLWVRPLSMFIESVQTKDGTVPRFAYTD
ncbi:DUF1653 domain-containing protein [Asticcacaulis endophyticus]|uniref:DUF1653 domain-containing protein n=1 Tax=Asticcacaulis endophyticus TaxID=1395890 RepID=A0A918UP34_9CAUL|nr:DUF1653 domain-containing protein [Asticcacaulis endophyticus]GGZ25533.1 hypothetical protein GCM10011273_08650 [Asticcacaulis endophyticus]